ncbi:type IV pilus modification PilV family protein [Parasporobacterium paucivorans]|uniref:Prepilin-type N-terminal cleavage/methylation domain-containing protein n=1 Tax=Parasporobacterium paucivorans DSM 15970 TaxID=1122934 RepID=A0A1M6IR56_9FIRM|nr:prepilin-type N-terminal cleavage/methylation domain-containing protein [Parasporobacterium paucivorans]SHJ36951.1 prepilin-type N-terminal cleavage/methylation domain-containing protein [Parasporobacterium paucivorans DSM 15970]
MKPIKSNRGLTLVEIIVAIAILGIILTAILSMFDVSIKETFKSGFRSKEVMEVQDIIDDLQTKFSQGSSSSSVIETYLSGKGYNKAATASALSTKVGTKNVNYFVQYKEITSGATTAKGYEVSVLKFFNNDNNTVRLTAFIYRSVE